jgi:hypothetical protein
MDPNHLILGAAVILGFVAAFGIRVIVKFYRSQRETERKRDAVMPR